MNVCLVELPPEVADHLSRTLSADPLDDVDDPADPFLFDVYTSTFYCPHCGVTYDALTEYHLLSSPTAHLEECPHATR